ncbi:zinc transport system permease protein [Amaricoccus macauensis]|uniref:High-affinity zinc uptake system membrane protein ZnuB n=1 Tax=Amaricoccus macauensis TaxID=57001 RepID=A0A840SN86_9RHOB|nr:zinc transport system permease protein [Amaricoccus macauensis]
MILDSFLIRAALAGVGVALAAAPIGAFVVWRRMAYFGDATAHAALLGVTLALATGLPVTLGVLVSATAMALTVAAAAGRGWAADTALGVAAHAALAIGIVALSFLHGVRVDLLGYLFGDILSVTRTDLAVIWTGAALIIGLVAWRWRGLLLATLNEDLAAASGVNPRREGLVLTLALAVLIAVALKIVGTLLITAMLVVPAAAARPLVRTPEAMAVLAAVVGTVAALTGLYAAWHFDTPAGPSMVVAAVVILVVTSMAAAIRGR